MPEYKNIGIIGEKVVLKVIEEKDLDKIFLWKNDYNLSLLIKSHPLPSARYEVEEWFRKNQSDKNQVLLGIYELESKKILGIVRLMFIDWISSTAEFGIFIGNEEDRNKGIGKETIKLALDFSFKDLKFNRIFLKVIESNHKAIEVYKSFGFIKEGLLREHFWCNNKYNDLVIMGLLKNDYLK